MKPVIVCISVKEKLAKELARDILLQRLALSCNIIKTKKIYWKEEDIEEENETVLILKTDKNKISKIEKEFEGYEIITIPVEANKELRQWIKEYT